jgi:hypothetical protein
MAKRGFVGRTLVVVLASALLGSVDVATAEPASDEPMTSPSEQACIPRAECCKVCSRGKACGNTCINRDYRCHKGRGCACDAGEICG